MMNSNIVNAQVCSQSWSPEEIEILPEVTIFVNFHFIKNEDGETFFDDTDGTPSFGSAQWFAQGLVDAFNNKMQNVEQNILPGPSGFPAEPIPNGDARLRMAFHESVNDDIYFYEYGENHEPKHGDAVLDVVLIEEPLDTNGDCMTRGGKSDGIPSTTIRLFNFYCDGSGPSDGINIHTFAHEVGHSLSLMHTHCCGQRAFDIDPMEECGQSCNCAAESCPGGGNNLMGDNASGFAITAGQLRWVYQHLLTTTYTNFEIENFSCEKTNPPIYINSATPVVWNGMHILNGDLVIQTGTVLTINCEVYMAYKAKIRVQRGARLIVNGMITSICEDKEWGGINVHGNTAVAHTAAMKDENTILAATDPGVLNLNGAVLQNAGTAVSTKRCCVPYAQQVENRGGLIVAHGAKFVNNRRAVQFLKYEKPNLSSFTTCHFFGNRGNRGVTVWDCEGITFESCVFEDLGENNDVGIATFDGGVVVRNNCRFNDLEVAIDCSNTAPFISGKEILIGDENLTRNTFNGNRSHDVRAIAVDDLTLLRNDFFDAKVSFRQSVRTDEETFFTIDDNAFVETGIRLRFNGIQPNLIFKNFFTDNNSSILGGIVVTEDNQQTIYDRNCFNNPRHDVRLLPIGSNVPILKNILGSPSEPLYNSFSYDNDAHSESEDFAVTNSSPAHTYFYHKLAETNNPSLIPRCGETDNSPDCVFTHNFVAISTDDAPIPGDISNIPCLSLNLSPPDDPQCITLDCLEDIRDSVNYKKGLLDDGDTDGLLYAIEYAPQSSGTLQLLNDASPYLTNEVLEALIINQNIAEADKEVVLMPNAPLPHSVMTTAEQHLTSATIANLESVQATKPFSDRLLLDSEISDGIHEYQRTLNTRLLELSKTESNADIEATLLFDNTDASQRRLFGFYLRTEDFTKAQTTLDNLPETTEEERIFKDIQTINLAFLSSTDSFILNPSQDSLLTNLAHQDKRNTGFARSLLFLLKDELVLLDESLDNQNQQIQASDPAGLKQNPQKAQLALQPNPANASVQITIPADLPLNPDSEIRVFDNSGKVAIHTILEEEIRQIEIQSGSLPNGFYTVSLWSNGKLITHSKLVISR